MICCVCGAPHSYQCINTNMRLSFENIINTAIITSQTFQSDLHIDMMYKWRCPQVQIRIQNTSCYCILCSYEHRKSPIIYFLPHILQLLSTTYADHLPRKSSWTTDDSQILHRFSSAIPTPWHYVRKLCVWGTEEPQTIDTREEKRRDPY